MSITFSRNLKILFVLIVEITIVSASVSFRNVVVKCYKKPLSKITNFNNSFTAVNVSYSNSLSEYYPKEKFNTAIVKGFVPVLYKDAISNSRHLKSLGLSENGIEEIKPGALNNLPSLRVLFLSKNRLREIKEGIFNNLSVIDVYLEENYIFAVATKAFDDMPRLRSIYFYYNQLSYWDSNWFFNTPNLRVLGFNNNLIEALPNNAFKNLFNKNNMEILLDFNAIKSVSHKIFGNLTNLNKLWLSSNQLDSWNEHFLDGIAITVFDISDNQLKCLYGDLKKFFVANYTNIDNNPWNCNCLKKIAELSISAEFVGERFIIMESALEKCNFPAYE